MTIQFDAHTEHVSPPLAPSSPVRERKVGGRIGAVVEGVRLGGDLDADRSPDGAHGQRARAQRQGHPRHGRQLLAHRRDLRRPRPGDLGVPRGVTLPAYGGSTDWANTVTADEGLPMPLKALVDNLWAVRTNAYDYARDTESGEVDADSDFDRPPDHLSGRPLVTSSGTRNGASSSP